MADGVGADEADLDVIVIRPLLCVVLELEVRNLPSRWWWPWPILGLLGWRMLCVVVMCPSSPSSSSAPPSTAASPSSAATSTSRPVSTGPRRRSISGPSWSHAESDAAGGLFV